MDIGKVPNDVLRRAVFSHLPHVRSEVVVGSGIGEDCAVLDLGGEACVVSTDPITGATADIGRLMVHVACNDVASAGAEPVGMTLTVLVPPSTTESEIEHIISQASETAAGIGVQIIGGHTEVTDAVNQPLVSATVIGRQQLDRVITTTGAAVGDVLVMTKHAGLEGAAILATERADRLSDALSPDQLERARGFAEELSVVHEGRIAALIGVSSMHDATEGGVVGATWEVAEACGHGIEVDADAIPIRQETRVICDHFGLDPMRLVSSGVMLMTVRRETLRALLDALASAGIQATTIGEVVLGPSALLSQRGRRPLEAPGVDELYRALVA